MITKVVFTFGAVLRGDDAAGPMFAKMLEQNPIPGWTYIDGGQTPEDDLAVIRRMQPDVLLLVDAAQMGREPGTIAVVDERDVVERPAYHDALPAHHLLAGRPQEELQAGRLSRHPARAAGVHGAPHARGAQKCREDLRVPQARGGFLAFACVGQAIVRSAPHVVRSI